MTNTKSYVAYRMALVNGTLVTLKTIFAVWNVSISHTSGNTACVILRYVYTWIWKRT